MSTHITRLRRQCQPVQEDTPVAPREHRISVDKRDLLQLLADYDAMISDLHDAMRDPVVAKAWLKTRGII